MKILTVARFALLTALLLCVAEYAQAQDRNQDGNQQGNQTGIDPGQVGTPGQSNIDLGQQTPVQQDLFGQSGPGGNSGQQQGGRPDTFVGSDAQQIRDQRANDPRARRRAMFDFAVESLNEMRESQRQRRANRNRKPPVRVQLRPLFAVQPPSATQLTTQVRSQLSRALPTTAGTAQISVSGGTATIQGTVQSDYDKQLAAKMLSMQPGITRVENRLTIGSTQAEPVLVPAQ